MMSQKQISEQSKCSHISRVKEWGFNEEHDFIASLWDCVLCGLESDTPFREEEKISIDHATCDYDPCFGCKAKGLQLNTGDAARDVSDKSWNNRLAFYRQARADGIQPNGTHPVQVEAAYKASETLGKAYNAEKMIRADKVTKGVGEVMKAIGD
jgi:hypothetical protein